MPYKLEIRPLATLEIIEAYDWYESKREGLGIEFLDALESFFDSLQRNPFTYSYYDEPVRQGKMSRFPYVIVYEVFDKKLIVYSVFMARQNPDKKRTF
jgi:toxin ParE1/3/4